MKENCPLCSPKIRDHIFSESGTMMAIYNIAPILPGHSMIVPKRHVESIFELNDDEFADLFRFSRETTHMLMNVFNADGFDWSLQESEAAGQSLSHLHLHIIPRKDGDLNRPGEWYALLEKQKHTMIDSPGRKKLSPEEMRSTVAYIQKHATGHAV